MTYLEHNLLVTKVENGFILTSKSRWEEENFETIRKVVEGDDSILKDEQDMYRRLLDAIAEHFGLEHDKWSKDNLNITFDKPGRKVE